MLHPDVGAELGGEQRPGVRRRHGDVRADELGGPVEVVEREQRRSGIGDHQVESDVVGLGRQVVDELLGERRADRATAGAQPGQEAVVVPAALAEAAPVGREGEAGHDDDVEVAGSSGRSGERRPATRLDAQVGPVDGRRERGDIVVPAPRGPARWSPVPSAGLRTASPGAGARPVAATIRSQIRAERARRSGGSAAIARRTSRIAARSSRFACT